jgi:hypothetical protein
MSDDDSDHIHTQGKIFVFGSNLAGAHLAGAALSALREHGAVWGQGKGFQRTSYAIPTKDHQIKTLPLRVIERHVRLFLSFAESQPRLEFFVTRIGCGLAGYQNQDIAPMFKNAPKNCELSPKWLKILGKEI